jgi:hypothetical protein
MKEQIRWRNAVEDSLTIDGKTLADAWGVSLPPARAATSAVPPAFLRGN